MDNLSSRPRDFGRQGNLVRLSRGQIALLLTGVGLFSLQFVPHYFTSAGFLFDVVYTLAYAVGFFAVVVATLFRLAIWVSQRDMKQKANSRRWFVTCLAISLAALGLTLASRAYARGLPIGSFVREFESEIWRNPSSERHGAGDITDRQKMLDGAIRKVPIGTDRSTVLDLLGHPVESSEPAERLVYCLGPDRGGFGIDSQWLTIQLDRTGRVSGHEIWED